MGVLGDDRIAVLIDGGKIESVEFDGGAERRAGIFVPADHLLLEVDRRTVPVLERDANAPHDEVAAAAHEGGTFIADPDYLIEQPGPMRTVLETHQIARRLALS